MKDEKEILYDKLCKENGISRKPIILEMIGGCAIFLCIILMLTGNMLYALIIFASIFFIAPFLGNKKFVDALKRYDKKVVLPVLQKEFEGITYVKKGGLTISQYESIGFQKGDGYNFKEYITLPYREDKIYISNIQIEKRVNKDSDMIVFDGYVSEFGISKDIQTEMKVLYNDFDLMKVKNDIPLDNTDFDKKYDVICEDTNYAVRMFTQDIMVKMMELHNKYKSIADIVIKNNKVYIRSRKEVGIMELSKYNYSDIEDKINNLRFIKELADIMYEAIENFEE